MTSRTIPKGCFGSVLAFSVHSATCASCDLRGDCRTEVHAREVRVLKLMKADVDRRLAQNPEDDNTLRAVDSIKAVGRAIQARRS